MVHTESLDQTTNTNNNKGVQHYMYVIKWCLPDWPTFCNYRSKGKKKCGTIGNMFLTTVKCVADNYM